jgi:hypothetical protein
VDFVFFYIHISPPGGWGCIDYKQIRPVLSIFLG